MISFKKNKILIFFILFFSLSSCCPEDYIKEKLLEFKEVCKNDIKELSIIAYRGQKVYHIKIKNDKIINEFKEAIINHTFIPKTRTGQFNNKYYFTIKLLKLNYSIIVFNDPYYPGLDSRSSDVNFYRNSNFDIWNDVYKHHFYTKDFQDSLTKYGYGDSCYQFRNYKLNAFLEKYIDEAIRHEEKNIYKIYVKRLF